MARSQGQERERRGRFLLDRKYAAAAVVTHTHRSPIDCNLDRGHCAFVSVGEMWLVDALC